ncbi:MAG: hypothetical protein AAGJ79_15465, partial [Verrucomicrobiota bacterium]
ARKTFPSAPEIPIAAVRASRSRLKTMLSLFLPAFLFFTLEAQAAEETFVYPGAGVPEDHLVWGLKDGIRLGLHPTRGPAGLIRVYAPYLGQPYPRVVNYLSIEPMVVGETHREQSELETSRTRPGREGLSFWATNSLDESQSPSTPVHGRIDPASGNLHVFIHTEPFPNGARPVVECVFDPDRPHEIELITHTAPGGKEMLQCILSATMGNYGQLRRLHLADNQTLHARTLWNEGESLDELGFLPWKTFPPESMERLPDGHYHVELSTDAVDPGKVEHDPGVKSSWRYVGRKAIHYWRAEPDSAPFVAVNARRTYWRSESKIPGGASFENFELNLPFQPGRRLWFGVSPGAGKRD